MTGCSSSRCKSCSRLLVRPKPRSGPFANKGSTCPRELAFPCLYVTERGLPEASFASFGMDESETTTSHGEFFFVYDREAMHGDEGTPEDAVVYYHPADEFKNPVRGWHTSPLCIRCLFSSVTCSFLAKCADFSSNLMHLSGSVKEHVSKLRRPYPS